MLHIGLGVLFKRTIDRTDWGVADRIRTPQPRGLNKYGRTLADGLLPDGTNVNHKLVQEGWCWWYRNYALGDTALEGLEEEAREEQKGLWADPQPVPPWEWRKRKEREEADIIDCLVVRRVESVCVALSGTRI